MRREERHHLKENPLAVLLTGAQRLLAERGRGILIGGGILLLAFVTAGVYFSWIQVQSQRAGELLVKAMSVLEAEVVPPNEPSATVTTVPQQDNAAAREGADAAALVASDQASIDNQSPVSSEPAASSELQPPPGSYASLEAKLEAALPMLIAVADEYPRTQQGVTARYQAATVLVGLDRADEATTHYRQVVEIAEDGLYGQMGLMGLAEAHLLIGQTQEAIALLVTQTGTIDSMIPVDAVLMRLGWAYQLAGQTADALLAFTRIVEEFPVSVYYADAQQLLESLRLRIGETALPSDG